MKDFESRIIDKINQLEDNNLPYGYKGIKDPVVFAINILKDILDDHRNDLSLVIGNRVTYIDKYDNNKVKVCIIVDENYIQYFENTDLVDILSIEATNWYNYYGYGYFDNIYNIMFYSSINMDGYR